MEEDLVLDVSIRNWVLIPIMILMILIGTLRHYMITLIFRKENISMNSIREMQAILRIGAFKRNGVWLPRSSYIMRKAYFSTKIEQRQFLKSPPRQGPPNLMTDPAGIERMLDGMKRNMFNIIPQTVTMTCISYFFSGFLLIKVTFPLTSGFKSMLQRGVDVPTLDPTWVSSISWYFLNLFGLKGFFSWILGVENAPDSGTELNPLSAVGIVTSGTTADMDKVFQSEKEELELISYDGRLDYFEKRIALIDL